MQSDDPEFLNRAYSLIEFYRENPEIAAEDLLELDLSAVQKVVLRSMWTKNYVMTIMCRGGGKTFINGVFACLKALLYPGHRVGLIAPTFRQSKMIFDECTKIWQGSSILQYSTEKRPTQQSDNCYIRFKAAPGRPPSLIQAIPLGDGTKIRGSRFYTIICDEFPHIPSEIFNMVIRPMAATVAHPMENVRRIRKQRQLLDAGLITQEELDREKESDNQIIITSSGYFTFNHMYNLYCVYKQQMLSGNNKYAVYRIPYTMIEEGFLSEDNINAARQQMSSLEFRMEYEAAFIPDTDNFYKASLIESCKSNSFSTQVVGSPGKSYCLGIDPARVEDSFAISVVELDRPARVVHAIELQKHNFPKMTRVIEDLCTAFNVTQIYMDAGGGGLAIKDILAENNQNDPRGPILDPEDEVHQLKSGRHILTMCNFGTDFISDSNFCALRLLEHRDLLFPCVPLSDTPSMLEEESWQTINRMKLQMQTIEMTETLTGKQHFDVPKGEGHGKQKKDLYTAFMLSSRCVYDLLWAEDLPESILHQTGVVKDREKRLPQPSVMLGGRALESVPEELRDRLELIQDPEAYKQKLMRKVFNKRTLITSPSAVLKPLPKKPRR